jgi:hypothetical protein
MGVHVWDFNNRGDNEQNSQTLFKSLSDSEKCKEAAKPDEGLEQKSGSDESKLNGNKSKSKRNRRKERKQIKIKS